MSKDALPIIKLTEKFASLPGIGRKTASRLAYHILTLSESEVTEFSDVLIEAATKIKRCTICNNYAEDEVCTICNDKTRDVKTICVIEQPKDMTAFERTGEYTGTYHILGGLISPMDGVNPEDIEIKSLLNRVSQGEVKEVIMATNPTVEGDVTAMYIAKMLKHLEVVTSRLAYGIPVGTNLEYADEVTLFKALENRNPI